MNVIGERLLKLFNRRLKPKNGLPKNLYSLAKELLETRGRPGGPVSEKASELRVNSPTKGWITILSGISGMPAGTIYIHGGCHIGGMDYPILILRPGQPILIERECSDTFTEDEQGRRRGGVLIKPEEEKEWVSVLIELKKKTMPRSPVPKRNPLLIKIPCPHEPGQRGARKEECLGEVRSEMIVEVVPCSHSLPGGEVEFIYGLGDSQKIRRNEEVPLLWAPPGTLFEIVGGDQKISPTIEESVRQKGWAMMPKAAIPRIPPKVEVGDILVSSHNLQPTLDWRVHPTEGVASMSWVVSWYDFPDSGFYRCLFFARLPRSGERRGVVVWPYHLKELILKVIRVGKDSQKVQIDLPILKQSQT